MHFAPAQAAPASRNRRTTWTFRVARLGVLEQVRVVLLDVEQDTGAATLLRDLGGELCFVQDRGESRRNQSTSPGVTLKRRKLCVKRLSGVALRSSIAF
jgi:hypothetical protein